MNITTMNTNIGKITKDDLGDISEHDSNGNYIKEVSNRIGQAYFKEIIPIPYSN